jgi:hypothetical protein
MNRTEEIMNKIIKSTTALLIIMAGLLSCTLDEELREDLTIDQVREFTDATALIEGIYFDMFVIYSDQSRLFAAQQHTSDETIGPTRGGDWDDNGIWRVLHDHTWDANHAFLENTFNELLRIVFLTSDALEFSPTPAQEAEIRFLRAFSAFWVVDGWGKLPFRTSDDFREDPEVLQGAEAIQFLIDEVEEILPNLDPAAPTHRANQDAARALLMKLYLNRATHVDRTATPYTFASADMDEVISLADEIIASGGYSVSPADEYFDNFGPNNGAVSTENIYTYLNDPGSPNTRSGINSIRSRWHCTLHYNMAPGGWNGFTTIADFYDRFDPNDVRLSDDYTGYTDVTGFNVGFLEGAQFDAGGAQILDRDDNPLILTKEVSLIERDNIEGAGIRVLKYPPDLSDIATGSDGVDNDIVFFRYSDVLLMKAEAILRGGTSGDSPVDLVNEIRNNRNVPPLAAVTLDDVLDERGFELYWESHRRTDLIRFGRFLEGWTEKDPSDPFRLYFAIPAAQVAVNPNLEQNPGY